MNQSYLNTACSGGLRLVFDQQGESIHLTMYQPLVQALLIGHLLGIKIKVAVFRVVDFKGRFFVGVSFY